MKKINLNDTDVIIIQKQTALERYTKRVLNVDFLDYLSQDDNSKAALNHSHHTHVNNRKILLNALHELNMKYIILNLDELKESRTHFFHEDTPVSSLCPKQKLVIALGGDGTLLHASHHVGAEVKLLGMNSCPHTSVGHLCAAQSENILDILTDVLIDKKENIQQLKRIRVQLSGHQNIPLALNDVLISHLHPAATSRYQISILNKDLQITQSEAQLSSGVWLSTAAGSTAAIASYHFEPQKLNSDNILVAAREPYTKRGESLQLGQFMINGSCEQLSIFSRMRQGLVCLDGPDFNIQFGFGEIIKISAPQNGALNLIYKSS